MFCSLFLGIDFYFFFYFLNCVVSFIYLLTGNSDKWLIYCLDLKNTMWGDNELVVSSKDISNQQNNQRIESGIPLAFGEDGCTIIHGKCSENCLPYCIKVSSFNCWLTANAGFSTLHNWHTSSTFPIHSIMDWLGSMPLTSGINLGSNVSAIISQNSLKHFVLSYTLLVIIDFCSITLASHYCRFLFCLFSCLSAKTTSLYTTSVGI